MRLMNGFLPCTVSRYFSPFISFFFLYRQSVYLGIIDCGVSLEAQEPYLFIL